MSVRFEILLFCLNERGAKKVLIAIRQNPPKNKFAPLPHLGPSPSLTEHYSAPARAHAAPVDSLSFGSCDCLGWGEGELGGAGVQDGEGRQAERIKFPSPILEPKISFGGCQFGSKLAAPKEVF